MIDTQSRMEGVTLRVPPHSLEAEQSVLGALLMDNRAFDRVADVVTEGEFYRREHRLIFAAIAGLVKRSKPADMVTVFERLQSEGVADEAGGLTYLGELANGVASAGNARRYAEIVSERATLRALIAACDDAATAAFNPQGKGASEIVDSVAQKLAQLERKANVRSPRALSDLLPARIDHFNDVADGTAKAGWSTGIPRLDRALSGGFRAGHVYILAARPSVGKSSLAQSMALHFAELHGPALMLSQEMPEDEVADRALANLGALDYGDLQTGSLNEKNTGEASGWGKLLSAVEFGRELPFYVDDQPALRLADIRVKARQVKGLKLLVLDYLQLCSGDGDNRNAEVEQISRGLKALAKELGLAVIALSQLNREVEKRANKEPQLSDLRDSGAIEQDADAVMFLWPDREYEGGARLVGFKLDKNRQGPKPRFGLHFNGAHQRWHESTELLSEPGGVTGKAGKKGFE